MATSSPTIEDCVKQEIDPRIEVQYQELLLKFLQLTSLYSDTVKSKLGKPSRAADYLVVQIRTYLNKVKSELEFLESNISKLEIWVNQTNGLLEGAKNLERVAASYQNGLTSGSLSQNLQGLHLGTEKSRIITNRRSQT